MDALTEARDTNRRLNRRLGDMEHHLHSMVSAAQNEAAKAQGIAATAQETARLANGDWWKKNHQVNDMKRSIERLEMWLFVVSVWAVAATASATWFAWH